MTDGNDPASQDPSALEEALSRSHTTIRSLEMLLHRDRARIAALEEQITGMKMADASMRARLRSACEARARDLAEAIARAERAEAEAVRAQGVVTSIHGSTTWRVMARIVPVLAAHPTARRWLRHGLRAMHRGLRFVRPTRSGER